MNYGQAKSASQFEAHGDHAKPKDVKHWKESEVVGFDPRREILVVHPDERWVLDDDVHVGDCRFVSVDNSLWTTRCPCGCRRGISYMARSFCSYSIVRCCRFVFVFLVADTQLYKRLCPSVRLSVRPSVHWSVRP